MTAGAAVSAAALATGLVTVAGAVVVWARRIVASIDAISKGLDRDSTWNTAEVEARFVALEDAVDRLPSKWEEVKREAKSFYQRALHHARRAQAELADRGFEDPELNDVAGHLRLLDGGGSDESPLQSVREGVEDDQQPPGAGLSGYEDMLRLKFATERR